jgi:hypothetical protein
MSGAVQERLREFTCRLLGRRGAEVDWPDATDQGLALLPTNVAEMLHCLEILPLAPDAASPLPINLSSDFLDRVEPLVSAEPPVVSLRIPTIYLKQSDMADPVARAFTWLNARVRVQSAEPVRTEYHTWFFLATVDSADRWQQVMRVTVNASSGARVPLPDALAEDVPQSEPADLPNEGPSTLLAAARAALGQIQTDSRPFIERLEGRLGRDRKRLQDYYRALLRGDGKRAARRAAEQDPAQRDAKAKAVQLELRRKLVELDERYACRVDLTPLALVRLDCPALAVQCHVQRRLAGRMHTLFWNPVRKELEPIACSRCGASTFAVAFSDNDVAALCAACHG